jgi:hypothetical protein
MIAIEPISERLVACPHCGDALYTLYGDRQEMAFDGGYLYHGGDTVSIYHDLAETTGYGWAEHLAVGWCPWCDGRIFRIAVCLMDVEPDENTEEVFFRSNGDRGVGRNFAATRGSDSWILTRFDTPQGPMVEHEFGPFADTYGDWRVSGGPWDFARKFLLERWEELRAMPKAVGLDPSDPRAQSKPALVTAEQARAAAPLPVSKEPPPPDDEALSASSSR